MAASLATSEVSEELSLQEDEDFRRARKLSLASAQEENLRQEGQNSFPSSSWDSGRPCKKSRQEKHEAGQASGSAAGPKIELTVRAKNSPVDSRMDLIEEAARDAVRAPKKLPTTVGPIDAFYW